MPGCTDVPDGGQPFGTDPGGIADVCRPAGDCDGRPHLLSGRRGSGRRPGPRRAEAFSALNGAADQAEVFTALASAAGDPAGPRTITAGDGTLDPELEEAAAALEEGQCSGILETDEGFSILRRLSTDSRELAGAWFDVQLQNAGGRHFGGDRGAIRSAQSCGI